MSETLIAVPILESLVPMSFAGALPLVERGIARAGISRYQKGARLEYPNPACHSFVYTVTGHAMLHSEGNAFPLQPDTLWVSHSGASYTVTVPVGVWEAMWLDLGPTPMWRHLEALAPHFRYAGQAARMVHVMSGLIAEANSPWQDSALMGRHFAEILGLFIDRRLHRGGIASDDDMRQRLGGLWERIGADLQHAWTIAEMSDILAVSPSHLFRVVQQAQGITPMGFLTQLRVQRAQDFLAHTPYKLDDIATRVGYVSAFALSKAFKRHTGLSPQDYRRKQGDLLRERL